MIQALQLSKDNLRKLIAQASVLAELRKYFDWGNIDTRYQVFVNSVRTYKWMKRLTDP
jgi:hypothetical protein